MRKTTLYLCITAFYLALFACSKKQADELTEGNPNGITAENVSYNNYVGSLLTTKCNSCHGPGGADRGFWAFNGIQSVTAEPRVKTNTLVTMTMPVGGSLTAREKLLLTAWYDRGMPAN